MKSKNHAARKESPPTPFKSTDPRAQRTRKAVLDAAIALLHKRGFGGCTVNAIIKETGVAKTTIYRHWPSRVDLLTDAIATLGSQGPKPGTGAIRNDLIEYFTLRTHRMASRPLDRNILTLSGLIEASKRDPALVKVSAQMVATLMADVRGILEDGKARGDVSRDRDLDVATNILLGAIFVQRAFLDKKLSDTYVIEVIDTLLQSISPSAAETRGTATSLPASGEASKIVKIRQRS